MARQTRPEPDVAPGQVWQVDGRRAVVLSCSTTHVVLQFPTRVERRPLSALVGAQYIGEEVRG